MNEDLLGLLIFLFFAASALLKKWRDRQSTTEPSAGEPAAVAQGDAVDPEAGQRSPPMTARQGSSLKPPAVVPSGRIRRPRAPAPVSAAPRPREAMIALVVYGPCRAEEPYPLFAESAPCPKWWQRHADTMPNPRGRLNLEE